MPDPCTPYSTASPPIDWSITPHQPHTESATATQLVTDRLAIAGSGAIACGLAATAARHGPVLLLARSASSARRARRELEQALRHANARVDQQHVQVVTDARELARSTFVVEAVVEDHDVKARLLAELGAIVEREAILAST